MAVYSGRRTLESDLDPSPHCATGHARLSTNRFVLDSGQDLNATSESANVVTCEAEGSAVRLCEVIGVIGRTHQARLVVKWSGKKDVTDLVGEHASERTRQLSTLQTQAHRAPGCSKREHSFS